MTFVPFFVKETEEIILINEGDARLSSIEEEAPAVEAAPEAAAEAPTEEAAPEVVAEATTETVTL